MSQKNTAVLIHGCHLQADLNGKTWEDIVWGGEMPTLEGRATMGIKVALSYGAQLIIFSTGASERDGVKEGEYTYQYALAHIDEIADAIGYRFRSVIDWLQRSELDLESQNTREECERNFKLCIDRGIERIILVSSPWHIQRCHTEALKVAEAMREKGMRVPEIVAVASHGSTEGLVILEPPHRGDRPKTAFHHLGVRLFKIPEAQQPAFERGLADLLQSYGA